MLLLAAALPHHDANLACFDGRQVRYLKLERTRQAKRFHFANLADWAKEVQDLWGLDPRQADDCVFSLDPGALPADAARFITSEVYHRLGSGAALFEPLPQAVCDALGVRSASLLSHHFAHALSAWMLQPRGADPHVAFVVDGVGDGRAWSVYRGDRLVAHGDIRHGSIGWGMREMGKRLGVTAAHFNDIAGKLMGLQAFGTIDEAYRAKVRDCGMDHLRRAWAARRWEDHVGGAEEAARRHLDWAASVHAATGDVLLDFFARFADPGERIAYSGGVAQNVVWNSVLKARFPHLLVPPHASDEGLALGALEWLRRKHGLPAMAMPGFPYCQSDDTQPPPSPSALEQAAQLLAQGRTVGLFQGHGEVGPRALGHRSILMDARAPGGHATLNRIKNREAYRPFGAAVLEEHFAEHFDGPADAFMLYACKVRGTHLPTVTHVDGSCRVQLVGASSPLRPLLERFHALTGSPVLANTSLNVAGRPIAASPAHAHELFARSPLDALCMGDVCLRR